MIYRTPHFPPPWVALLTPLCGFPPRPAPPLRSPSVAPAPHPCGSSRPVGPDRGVGNPPNGFPPPPRFHSVFASPRHEFFLQLGVPGSASFQHASSTFTLFSCLLFGCAIRTDGMDPYHDLKTSTDKTPLRWKSLLSSRGRRFDPKTLSCSLLRLSFFLQHSTAIRIIPRGFRLGFPPKCVLFCLILPVCMEFIVWVVFVFVG